VQAQARFRRKRRLIVLNHFVSDTVIIVKVESAARFIVCMVFGDEAEVFHFPPIGFKPPASSRSASANLVLISPPEF